MGPWCYVNKPGAAEEVKKKLKFCLTTHKAKHVFSRSVLKVSIQFNSVYTVQTHNKHAPYKHFPHNKHTLFGLTKMCLFEEEEDFGKINSLYFFQH